MGAVQMSKSQETLIDDLLDHAQKLKSTMYYQIIRGEHRIADSTARKYEKLLKQIINHNSRSIDQYEKKLKFVFELILDSEGHMDKEFLADCQNSLLSDLSNFKIA